MSDTTTPRPDAGPIEPEMAEPDLVERDVTGTPVTVDDDRAPDRPDHAPARPHAHADSSLDRLARRVLGLRDAEPRALIDLQGSLVLSAVRCLITYVAIPVLLPAIAWAGVVARPIGLVLAILAVGLSIRSLRRVWQANWTYRWAYTVFVAVVVGLLCVSIVLDVRFFLA